MNPNPSLLLLLAIPLCGRLHAAAPDRGFVSRQPAVGWQQALVTGNGIQGAMVYGVPNQGTIILNHGRLYLPLHPPLPKQWPAGCVDGVRCRGNIEVRSLRWSPDRIEATLRSGTPQTITVSLPGEPSPRRVHLPAGEPVRLAVARTPP